MECHDMRIFKEEVLKRTCNRLITSIMNSFELHNIKSMEYMSSYETISIKENGEMAYTKNAAFGGCVVTYIPSNKKDM